MTHGHTESCCRKPYRMEEPTFFHVVACLTREDTLARMTLPEAISRLKASGIDIILATPELITEQRPERLHRSGGIQKGKVPVVLENLVHL